jgi:acetyl esterase/lipase
VIGTAPPKMEPGLSWSAVRIPRRKFDDDALSGPEDPIEAEIIEHEGVTGVDKAQQIVVLNFFGGGHTTGEPRSVRPTNIEFSKLLKCKCVSPTYRLSPAEPYPAPLHDAVSTYLVSRDPLEPFA